jgi:DNA-directed RNA polymerase subunit RPC12/RpoP
LSDVTMCPRCKSYKWSSPMGVVSCSTCGKFFTTKSKKSRVRCPECQGRQSFECQCAFCGSEWISEDPQWKACPVCGSSSKQAWSGADRDAWSDGVRTIRYVPVDESVVFYLWIGDRPVSVCHESDVLEYLDVSSGALRLRFKDDYYDRMWAFLADCMYA